MDASLKNAATQTASFLYVSSNARRFCKPKKKKDWVFLNGGWSAKKGFALLRALEVRENQ